MTSVVLPYDHESFNELPTIDAANATMRAGNNLDRVLADLQPLFERHEMCARWALGLLHKHWTLTVGERPIQDRRIEDGRTHYVTLPRESVDKVSCWPTVLRFGDSPASLQPLEWSVQEDARESNEALKSDPLFIVAIRDVLVHHGVCHLFGLVVPKSRTVPYRLVEYNYSDRVSVLSETLPEEIEGKRLIQTAWVFESQKIKMDCPPQCLSYCVFDGDEHVEDGHSPPYHSLREKPVLPERAVPKV